MMAIIPAPFSVADQNSFRGGSAARSKALQPGRDQCALTATRQGKARTGVKKNKQKEEE
jgi:hypothetical protein